MKTKLTYYFTCLQLFFSVYFFVLFFLINKKEICKIHLKAFYLAGEKEGKKEKKSTNIDIAFIGLVLPLVCPICLTYIYLWTKLIFRCVRCILGRKRIHTQPLERIH